MAKHIQFDVLKYTFRIFFHLKNWHFSVSYPSPIKGWPTRIINHHIERSGYSKDELPF